MTSNKITRLLSASVLTAAMLCTTPAMAASVTATENVRVRSGAGTSYSVISMLYKGDSATKLSSSGGWVKVKVGSKTGYVSADFVTSKTSSSSSSTKKRYCVASSLNVRSKANTSARVIGSLSRGKKVTIVKQSGGWSRIKYGGGYGYVSSEYLSKNKPSSSSSSSSSAQTRYCTASTLNVRSKASASASVIGSLSRGKKVIVVSRTGEWSRIKYGSGYGYAASEYLSNSKPSGASVSGSSIVAAAKRMSNCTYKYGAEGPKQYDCSSFTQKAYRDCGIAIPRTSTSQYSQCTRVSKSNLRAGNLVFFNSEDTSSVCHVGIYIGNNRFIHAANSKRDVCTDSLNSRYYKKHFISGGRYT